MLGLRARVCFLLPFLLLPNLFAQTGEGRIAPIVSALRNQQFDQALVLLHTALLQSPGNAELWTMQGVAYKGAGNKEAALISFRHALKLSPDDLAALQGAAQIDFDAGDTAGIPLL